MQVKKQQLELNMEQQTGSKLGTGFIKAVYCHPVYLTWASLVAQLVNNPPAVWETWVGKIPWRRGKLPTPVFWPGEFHGLYSPWGRKESDMMEGLSLSLS